MKRLLKHDFYRFCATLLLAFSLLVASFSENIELLFAAAPTITTGAATSITQTSAVLHGTIPSTGGKGIQTGGFNYGTTVSYGNTILKDVPYTFNSEIGMSGTGPGQFDFADELGGVGGLAVDASNNVYVADLQGNITESYGRIQIFNSSGVYQSEFGNCYASGSIDDEVCWPTGVDVDLSGNIVVAQSSASDPCVSSRIAKFDSSYSLLDVFGVNDSGETTEGHTCYPKDTTTDSGGNVYVADTQYARIDKFDQNGNFVEMYGWGVATGTSQFEVCTSSCQIGLAGSGDGQFDAPGDIVIDQSGNFLVVDQGNNRVQKFDSSFTYQSQFGTNGSGDGEFDAPRSLVIDSSGNIFVTDSLNSRVQKFDSSGAYLLQFGSPGNGDGEFNTPGYIAIDHDDNVYVSESGYTGGGILNYRVQKFDSNGNYILQLGSNGAGDGYLKSPGGLGIDATNNLYVIDSGHYRTQKFNSSGSFVLKFDPDPSQGTAQDIDVDLSGNIFITGFESSSVLKYDNSGVFQSSFGSLGSGDGEFQLSVGILIDALNNMFVSDSNGRVQKFDPAGSYVSQFGSLGAGDGQFDSPSFLDFDPLGNIYVVDDNNARVQKFNSAGVYQSQFGTAGSGDGQFDDPSGIAIDSIGNIYVVDRSHDRVEKFNSSGIYQSQFGTPGYDDGEFGTLQDIAIDSSDNLFISDSTNNVIHKFTQSSFTATLTGLNCQTTYHFRAFATNADGTTNGSDATFQTSNCGGSTGGGGGPTTWACSDHVDNDGDGIIDYPADPGCSSASDLNEFDHKCNNRVDDDGDGFIDYADGFAGGVFYQADPGCDAPDDMDEQDVIAACSDGLDNDSNGFIDYPADPNCSDAGDDFEGSIPECSDYMDNDNDGFQDYPDDPECSDPNDTESEPATLLGCTNPAALNYDPLATTDDNSCIFAGIPGCTDPAYDNYSPAATVDDGSCDNDTTIINPPPPPPPPPPPWWPPVVPYPPIIPTIIGAISGAAAWLGFKLPIVAKAAPIIGLAIPLLFLIFRKDALAQTAILLSRFWSILPTLMGLKRKKRPWGTVYDSVTKQPLDPVHVSLMDSTNTEIATSITDLDGRYGFLVRPGSYTMKAGKDSYVFPSVKMAGKTKDELYDNLYFGETMEIKQADDLIIRNIPMDAVNFNWNEFTKAKNKKLMKFFSKSDLILAKVATIFFVIGLIVSILAVWYDKTTFNIIIFSFYVLIIMLRIFGVRPAAPGTIAEDASGEPLSFAVVRVYSAALGTEIAHSVASATGKYYSLIPKGNYYIKIEKKTGEDAYEEVHNSDPFSVKKGFIDKNFRV